MDPAAFNVDMNKSEIIRRILDPGIVAIIRADNSAQLVDATQALIDGGVTSVEVTMTTPNALQVIRETTQKFGDKLLMGVGTVLDDVTARLAMEAGAQFVVTPVFRADVVTICRRYGKPVMSGAFTPTEALIAHEAGSDFIKIFPAEGLGPTYMKSILAPLPQLEIIPTGGVTAQNCGEFIKAGCVAVGAGSSLVSKEILKNKDWKTLTSLAAEFVAAMRKAKGS
jgi:2-dehydro-3-deoxyphosphogluconate aldolase/(4S)-4-hydroxy-2-oxoglutarate aldolase